MNVAPALDAIVDTYAEKMVLTSLFLSKLDRRVFCDTSSTEANYSFLLLLFIWTTWLQ